MDLANYTTGPTRLTIQFSALCCARFAGCRTSPRTVTTTAYMQKANRKASAVWRDFTAVMLTAFLCMFAKVKHNDAKCDMTEKLHCRKGEWIWPILASFHLLPVKLRMKLQILLTRPHLILKTL